MDERNGELSEELGDDVTAVPLERLKAEICELAGHLWAAECRWLLMIGEFDRREAWSPWGLQSCAHWLSWRCGVALNAARERVRVARRLADLPLITAAFSRGELSYAKVRALTRVANDANEPELAEIARTAPRFPAPHPSPPPPACPSRTATTGRASPSNPPPAAPSAKASPTTSA